MRAVVLTEEGPADVMRVHDDVDVPTPGDGEIRVRITHASLNHLDVWIRKGMPSVPKPRVTGADGAGVVDAVGDGVDDLLVGSRVLIDPSVTCHTCRMCTVVGDTALCDNFAVLGEHRAGTHAEYVVVPARNAHAIPEHLDDAHAAALPLVYATAWRMLFTRLRVAAGERVLVWAGSAGVGAAAIQLAATAGAEVIATTRSAAKADALQSLGAHHVVVTGDDMGASDLKELAGRDGYDAAFDSLGNDAWKPSMQLLRKGGRYVTCGATTGANPPAQITRLFWKQLTMMGSTMASDADFAAMIAFVEAHQLSPRIDRTLDLADIAAAHAYLESAAHVGKVVLRV